VRYASNYPDRWMLGRAILRIVWSQASARISEMNDLGWQIASITLPKSRWRNGIRTAYRLDSKPLQIASPVKEKRLSAESNYTQRVRADDARPLPLFAETPK
jgi:hypothetical protein